MKAIMFLAVWIMMLVAGAVQGQALPGYYSQNDFLQAPPGVFHEGLLGFVNPAVLVFLKAPETRFFWSTDGKDAASIQNWGSFSAVRGLGFGIKRSKFESGKVTDYRIALGFGDPRMAMGLAYGWSAGDDELFGREKMMTVGGMYRPSKYVSAGLLGSFSLESSAREGAAELGVRPWGNEALTLFADGAWQKGVELSEAPWSVGAVVQMAPGIDLVGRFFDGELFTVGMTLNFGRWGIGGQGHYDGDRKLSHYSYSVRSGGLSPSIFNTLGQTGKRYYAGNLKGRVDYHKYLWFDSGTLKFLDIINEIRTATDDPRVAVLAFNLSSLRILPEHAWEIREEMIRARQAGKKVIVFVDHAEMTLYHLATAADKIVLDPQGTIMLPGYTMGKTYFKGTLAKLGLAFDEWRFFKYKSAAEVLSRDKMSDADREQYQNYVDDRYEQVRQDICTARGLTSDRFDQLVDEKIFFMPEDARAENLVDTLARWSDLKAVAGKMAGKNLREIKARNFLTNDQLVSTWGMRPRVAIVYGLGECAMDSGIRARWLERVFLNLARNRSVKAVVFRVDSPGGEGLASDLVAEALRKCAAQKPVIVSQGQVAGSGGYYISMYGDTIVAAPMTITGSIGVIGGWLYDAGLGSKLGMSSDFVRRGRHADFGSGIRVPFINQEVPARNLIPDEREKVENIIRTYYDNFVDKVAAGRGMEEDEVRRIAEGQFYSGTAGKKIGLVDEIGGLMTAIGIAETKAGLDPDEVEIVEIPQNKGLFKFPAPSSPFSLAVPDESVYRYIELLLQNRGGFLPLMIPGTYPTLK